MLTLAGLITRFFCAHVLHLDTYPYAFYSLPHDGDGVDLMNFYIRFQQFHSPGFFSPDTGSMYAYPAPVALLYWVFYRVRYAQIPFLLCVIIIMAWLAWRFVHALRRRGLERKAAFLFVVSACVCSYPFYFEFTRANMEFFMWLFAAAGVYFILRDRPWLGAALVGVAISMKLYPFMLLGLLVSRRQYRQAAFGIIVAAGLTLLSLWLICPDIGYAWHQINAGVTQFQTKFVIVYWPVYIGVDHSLFGVFKRALGVRPRAEYATLLAWYTRCCAALGVLLYLVRMRKLPMLNQVLCLSVASILLPPVSFDYTLIHLYTPFAMWALYLMRCQRGGQAAPGARAMLVCFLLLLSQIGEVILHGDRLSGQIKALALLALFVLGLWFQLPSEFDEVKVVGSMEAAAEPVADS